MILTSVQETTTFGCFLEANVLEHSSYTWRNLAQARHIIRLGTHWRTGDGSQVNIWHDNWITVTHPMKVLSPRQILPETARVCDLINHDTMQWRNTLINSIFLPMKPLRSRLLCCGLLLVTHLFGAVLLMANSPPEAHISYKFLPNI